MILKDVFNSFRDVDIRLICQSGRTFEQIHTYVRLMNNNLSPIPENELRRLISLSALDLDYNDHDENFKDLTLLAAKVAGTEISLINLIDSYTQWSIAGYGITTMQIPREESVCQYTIMSDDAFEVCDLSLDERFSTKFYVEGPMGIRYYYGLPLQMSSGVNIGALCVLDSAAKTMTPDKIELLQIIAETVVKRLKSFETLKQLQAKLDESNQSQKKVAHDIRGPLAGIVGLSEIIGEQVTAGGTEEMLELVGMINKSGTSLLELTDEILTEEPQQTLHENEFNLQTLKEKLEKLYVPQARYKSVSLNINVNGIDPEVTFPKNQLIQITGNLISNAIKFTPSGGEVAVDLSMKISSQKKVLQILVNDTGIGIDSSSIDRIILGKGESTSGTIGEKGYGLGLSLVAHLVESLKGEIKLRSTPGQGACFEVLLPQSL
jgi:signal transduction histidine kinase